MVASRAGWHVLTALASADHAPLRQAARLWHLVPFGHLVQLDRPGALLAGTAAAVALLLAAALAVRVASRPAGGGGPLADGGAPPEWAPRDGTPRYTDPDAPGRARPRAPCAALAAAAGVAQLA
jgi:hypothetical protein